VKRFLITTALEETWRDDEPVLFLGEWCKRYSRKLRWGGLDAKLLSYHWDDRRKLHTNYLYLQDFQERLLVDLSGQLNQIHGVDHGVRYWRILIGPWLGYFTQMLFDRWCSIQQAVSQYDLSGTIVLTGQEEVLTPGNMTDFNRLSVGDEWNHLLYAMILRQFTNVPCIERVRQETAPVTVPLSTGDWIRKLKRALAAGYSRAASILSGDRGAFLMSTYLPIRDEIRMNQRLGQIPQLWRSVPPVQVDVVWEQRQWIACGEDHSDFETCAHALIPLQMPTAYLEGYCPLVRQVEGLPWPRQPKVVWTSNSESSDDVFKAWVAEKVESGTPLVIGQHGGHYGMGRWSFEEDHEIAISDHYLSWGWSEPGQPKIVPVGQVKTKSPLGVVHAGQPRALLVTCALPRYSYWLYSAFVSRQYLDYFDDQCAFIEHLPQPIRDALTVRLYSHDYGWDQEARWRDQFPCLNLDNGRSDMNQLIRQSRLYIATYNATTFLESFTMNVPTVMFWNPLHWELRESATPFFQELKRVGVFHETPESAACHVATIWSDVDEWWSAPETQAVLSRFKAHYCHLPDGLLDTVETVLRDAGAIPSPQQQATSGMS